MAYGKTCKKIIIADFGGKTIFSFHKKQQQIDFGKM